jgi:hypothetical protein
VNDSRYVKALREAAVKLAKAAPESTPPRYSTDRHLPKRLRRTRRDGNEQARKGLGCTNRSCRKDWLSRNETLGTRKLLRTVPIEPWDGSTDVDDAALPYWEQVGGEQRDAFYDGTPIYSRDFDGRCYPADDPFMDEYLYEPYGGYDDPPFETDFEWGLAA